MPTVYEVILIPNLTILPIIITQCNIGMGTVYRNTEKCRFVMFAVHCVVAYKINTRITEYMDIENKTFKIKLRFTDFPFHNLD